MKINIWAVIVVAVVGFVAYRGFVNRTPEAPAPAPASQPAAQQPGGEVPAQPLPQTSAQTPAQGGTVVFTKPALGTPACLQQFDPEKDLPELNKKITRVLSEKKSVDVKAIDAGMQRYASCASFLKRSDAPCKVLNDLASRWGDTQHTLPYCKDIVRDYMMYRDLAFDTPFDALDYAWFTPLAPQSNVREAAEKLQQLWKVRHPNICGELKPLLHEQALPACQALLKNILRTPFTPRFPAQDPRNIDELVLHHLWFKTQPDCENLPMLTRKFVPLTAMNYGLCAAMFERSCDRFSLPARNFFCSVQ